jgi:hypothetical protein
MANLRQEIAVGSTGAEFVAAFEANTKNANIRVYNVEDYGAVHNGVTDDTTAIQLAINACFDAGGGVVYFPNGVYIIGGALQNAVDGIDYNSQLYIPGTKLTNYGPCVRLIGESYNASSYHYNATDGVILKSTIAGTGVHPSVICGRSTLNPYSYNSYTKTHIENMRIFVDANEGDGGPTMCGINLIFNARSYLNNVVVGVDVAPASMAEPTNKVFGIAQGFVQDDFPQFGNIAIRGGFYYGAVLGEGVNGQCIESFYNKHGLMLLKNYYPVHINYAMISWNTYSVISQDDTYYGEAAGRGTLKIGVLATEISDRNPVWTHTTDSILDASNYIYGEIAYNASTNVGLGEYLTKSNGGLNLLMRNIYTNSHYHWTTATRPATPGYGTTGWNTTTSKLECWNGATWGDLH